MSLYEALLFIAAVLIIRFIIIQGSSNTDSSDTFYNNLPANMYDEYDIEHVKTGEKSKLLIKKSTAYEDVKHMIPEGFRLVEK